MPWMANAHFGSLYWETLSCYWSRLTRHSRLVDVLAPTYFGENGISPKGLIDMKAAHIHYLVVLHLRVRGGKGVGRDSMGGCLRLQFSSVEPPSAVDDTKAIGIVGIIEKTGILSK